MANNKKRRPTGTRENDSLKIYNPNFSSRDQREKLNEIKSSAFDTCAKHQYFRSKAELRREAEKLRRRQPVREYDNGYTPLELTIMQQHAEPNARQRLPLEKSADSFDVLVILRIVSDKLKHGYRYVFIKDRKKGRIGFVIGGKDDPARGIIDVDFIAAAKRECGEEALCDPRNASLELRVHPDGCIGTIQIGTNHFVKVFVIDVDAAAVIAYGKDQEWVGIRSYDTIEKRMIPQNVLLSTHASAWDMYKVWLARQ